MSHASKTLCDQELGDCRHHTFACEGHRAAQQQDGGVLHFSPIIPHFAARTRVTTWQPGSAQPPLFVQTVFGLQGGTGAHPEDVRT